MSIETLTERALWLADLIPAYGDYAAEAAHVLRMLAAGNDKLREALADVAVPDGLEPKKENTGMEYDNITMNLKLAELYDFHKEKRNG